MKRKMHAILPLVAAMAVSASALETTEILLRDGAVNDGEVSVTRSGSSLVFDDGTTLPVTLGDLLNAGGDHGSLGGLDDDDHLQYHNAARHSAAHDAAFNDALVVSPDVAGNATLGAHLGDADVHLSRTANELVSGDWVFTGAPELQASNAYLSGPDEDTPATIWFRSGSGDARLTWDPLTALLYFNAELGSSLFSAQEITAQRFYVGDIISGTLDGVTGGRLTGFDEVMGIAGGDLLSRTRDEDVTGAWDFLSETSVAVSGSDTTSTRTAAEHSFAAMLPPGSSVPSGFLRAGSEGTATLDSDTATALSGVQLRGVRGTAELTGAAGSVTGLAAGVEGTATSAAGGMASAGVAGVVSGGSSARRAAVLGATDADVLTDPSPMPEGAWAGVFLGDVHVSGSIESGRLTTTATNAGSATIQSGQVVRWRDGGVELSPGSGLGPYAGVAVTGALAGTPVTFVTHGIADVTASGTISAGTIARWTGSSLQTITSLDGPFLGVALEDHAIGGSGSVPVFVNPGYVISP